MRYQSRLRPFGREKWLRSHPTEAETELWSALRSSLFKFRRQHRIGKLIVDFYCPEVRLAVEVDGGVHSSESARVRDCERDERLTKLGVNVVHFGNEEIFANPQEVLSIIEEICLFL